MYAILEHSWGSKWQILPKRDPGDQQTANGKELERKS